VRENYKRGIEAKLRSGEFQSLDALIKEALTFFLDFEMDDAEVQSTKASVEEALEQAGRGEGVSLEEFDRSMRAKG
jgi:Arc/MetJ-type ribon-helix-helix transcriptional regulator